MSECDLLPAGDPAGIPLARGPASNPSTEYARTTQLLAADPRRNITMAGPQALARSPLADAEKILRAFNTWAFKREQPSDPQLMLATIARSVPRNAPLSFVLYWGKGPRRSIGHWDIECLDFLSSLARRVRQVYLPGASIKLILTDTHARLNGHPQTAIAHYFGDIEQAAGERGFATCWLGDLVKAPGLKNINTADDPPPDMLQKLLASASKWYRGSGSPEQGAIDYYRVNMLEKRAVENSNPQSIFITFNGSEFRNLLPPQLPIFYMYSLRRGTSTKPWFLPSDAELGSVATAHGAQLPEKMHA